MRHKNSVFHAVLKHVPWSEFDRLVEEHEADFRVRRLTTKSQLVALLYGQLSGAASLREIVTGLQSHAARLYHVGAGPVQRSTLADANAARPSEVFTALFALMVKQAHRGLRRTVAETTYLINSTAVRLNSFSDWANSASAAHRATTLTATIAIACGIAERTFPRFPPLRLLGRLPPEHVATSRSGRHPRTLNKGG